jgi:septation ring formation regulator EzrA
MADEFEQQLERIEQTVAEIAEALQRLRDDRAATEEAASGEINQRLRRFLERKKQA